MTNGDYVDRASSKIDFDGPGGCWLWKNVPNGGGYALMMYRRESTRVHRRLYEELVEPVPSDLDVDHLCHVRHCVNPDHLRVTPRVVNVRHRLGANSNSKSGVRGVTWSKHAKKWKVEIRCAGRTHLGGYFESIIDAERVAVALRLRLFGEVAAPQVF